MLKMWQVVCGDWSAPEDFGDECIEVEAVDTSSAVEEWSQHQDDMWEVDGPLTVYVKVGGFWVAHDLVVDFEPVFHARKSKDESDRFPVTNGSREPLRNDAQTATSEKA